MQPLQGGIANVTWSPVTGATGYKVFNGSEGPEHTLLATVTEPHAELSIPPGTELHVAAFNTAGTGP